MSAVRFSLYACVDSDPEEPGPKVTRNKKFNYFDALIYGANPFEPLLSFNMQQVAAVTSSHIIKDNRTLKFRINRHV